MRRDPAPTWYLFDYGMVISTAPGPDDWTALREATGVDLEPAGSPYWTNRQRFDAGELDPVEYWSQAAGRRVGDRLVQQLEAIDATLWSHVAPASLLVLQQLHAQGVGLALLSNMPAGLSWRLAAQATWLRYFSHTFFSGRLAMAKPDPRVFRHVLAELAVEAGQVVFVDDNPANVDTARGLGFRTVLHTAVTDLAAELGLPRQGRQAPT